MLKTTVAAFTLLTSAAAMAQDTTYSAFSVQADLGSARHNIGTDDEDESGSAFAPSLALAYQINQNWSARLQYTDLGEFTVLSGESYDYDSGVWVGFDRDLKSSASWLGLTAQYQTEQLVQQWSVGARLGAAFWKQEFTLTDTITSVSNSQLRFMIGESFSETGSDSGVGLLAGVFAQYHFTEQLAFTLDLDLAPFSSKAAEEISVFQGMGDVKADYHVTRLAAGIQYRF
ncbi:outer membrane beta-barrel protein [Rheinheimera sp. 4Y26]|uniref:outer membrane beta-barrel protein n=1 Tax=Rheinheimera sp. 4Y26 TaxID=2977811 RepID=UPI0021B0ADFF|nr:outer membrane beta-barrel protein [Rheinheimera sp. 4Y26]MCT6700417.1 outer membrane beta-barrel protein [Rheinheimera sp. 4Y26]